MTTTTRLPHNKAAMARANAEAGGHWFDRGTMQFFDSRICRELFPNAAGTGLYFVSSERSDDESPRLWTVRFFEAEDAVVSTIGEFQGYVSEASALSAASSLATA